MTCPDARTLTTGALSIGAVAAPAVAAAGCLALALRRTTPLGGPTEAWWPRSDPAVALGTVEATTVLLQLACLALALVLAWAAVAVAAGVQEGWRLSHGAGKEALPPAALHPAGLRTAAPATTSHPGGLVAAAVAALVVAALAAPAASAAASGAGSGTGSGVQVTTPAVPGPDGTVPGPDSTVPGPDDTVPGAADAPPGSWTALTDSAAAGRAAEPVTESGFLAPRTVDPGASGLVTSPDTRSERAVVEVVVHRGDSLWSLVADHLGPAASDAEVARAWPDWWQHNRDVIGDDPDTLLPGQTLLVPAS